MFEMFMWLALLCNHCPWGGPGWTPCRAGEAKKHCRQEDRKAEGWKPGFPAFPSMEIPPVGRRKDNAAHCAGGRGVYRALGGNKCTEKSKSQRERGSKWRKRRGKMRKLSSPVLAAENAAVFLILLFFRLWKKSSKAAGDKVKHLLQDNSNIKKQMLYCVIPN